MGINIAIDGPAGAGKSTIAKSAARVLNYIYVDTGALYRTLAYFAIQNNVSCSDEENIIPILKNAEIELKFENDKQCVFLNGTDISDFIRTPEISMGASDISAIPYVRTFLFDLQKNIAAQNNVIMDGRDIGTVVLPDADVKIFLTASPECRAERRYKELIEKGQNVNYDDILADIIKRDYNDTHRDIAPLKQADDAVLIDTSLLSLSESENAVIDVIKNKLQGGK